MEVKCVYEIGWFPIALSVHLPRMGKLHSHPLVCVNGRNVPILYHYSKYHKIVRMKIKEGLNPLKKSGKIYFKIHVNKH